MRIKQGAAALGAMLCLISCGGGGSSGPTWTPIPDIEFRSGTPPVLMTTVGAGSTFRMECTVTSHGYWAETAHLAIDIMQDLSLPYLQGHGLAIGRTGDLGYLNIDQPRFTIETWSPSAGLLWGLKRDSYLPPETLSPVLADATPYPFTLTTDGYTIRYTAAGYDSGRWGNRNHLFDMTARGLVIGSTLEGPTTASLALSECRYRWGTE